MEYETDHKLTCLIKWGEESSSTGLPFSTLIIVLHLKDRSQSNEQTNKTRTNPMNLNNPGGDQYTQNHP